MIFMVDKAYRQQPTNDLLGFVTISTERTVDVTSAPMTEAEKRAVESGFPYDSASNKTGHDGVSHPPSPTSEDYDPESLEFHTKPAGF